MQIQFARAVVFTITAIAVHLLSGGNLCTAQNRGSVLIIRQDTQHRYGLNPSATLISRVSETPGNVLSTFREAGMSPREHKLTYAERIIIANAFASLPPLHRRILKERLKSISFLDDMPNTALTSAINPAEPYNLYHITIRAAILNENITQWLTAKERTCFDTMHSPLRVTVNGGILSALVYVLIHETTHVVDASLGITGRIEGKQADSFPAIDFSAGIWEDRTMVAPVWRDSLLQQIIFRRGGKVLPAEQAVAVYRSLQKTPFVSLYGSSARSEDIAEYVTVFHITHQLKQPFKIVITDGRKKLFEYEPIKAAAVKSRIGMMKYFYEAG